MLRGPGVALACLLAGASAAGCAALGPTGDGTSVAYGFHNAGELIDGVRLPVRGDGYLIPGTWAMPCVPIAGIQNGMFALPIPGSGVWVEFEQGDPERHGKTRISNRSLVSASEKLDTRARRNPSS